MARAKAKQKAKIKAGQDKVEGQSQQAGRESGKADRSLSTGRRRTASRSRSCWKSVSCPTIFKPVNISKGEQFQSGFPENRAEQSHAGDCRSGWPRRQSRFSHLRGSGAILQYLGRKTGKFYPSDERGRVEVEQWLYWQMGGVGPMAGQVHHFKNYAVETLTYAINRYVNEVKPALWCDEQAARRFATSSP